MLQSSEILLYYVTFYRNFAIPSLGHMELLGALHFIAEVKQRFARLYSDGGRMILKIFQIVTFLFEFFFILCILIISVL